MPPEKSSPLNIEEVFQDFLRTTKINYFHEKYRLRLAQLALTKKVSLLVDFDDLIAYSPQLARLILDTPEETFKVLNRQAWAQLKIEDPEYAEEIKQLPIRIRRIPDHEQIRKLNSVHIGKLVAIDGIIVRASVAKPLLMKAHFQCKKCNALSIVEQAGQLMRGPGLCAHCRSKIFEFLEKPSEYITSQEFSLQERPEDLPPGQLPRTFKVKLTGELVDTARPGDRVTVTGIVKAQQEFVSRRVRLRTFDLELDANYADVLGKDIEIVEVTPEDERRIQTLSEDPFIVRKLIASLAPSIYGYGDIKEAVLYQLMGGVPKVLPDGIRIRGEANIFLIGDPGTAKSQLLQYVARIAPRGIYTSGRGTSAAGLTCAVLKEKSGGMVLEAGALVLADKGICCCDEADKMRPEDRVAIHEPLEQHTVSIAKGGIVATLNARAAVLMAANPAMGRYDPYRNISDNINLPVTLLSRMDLIFVMKDVPDADADDRLSKHILSLHRNRAPPEESPITPELLRKYVAYARKLDPVLTEESANELHSYYLKMRSLSSSTESSVAITPRQLEALVRLSEARAKCLLHEQVTVEDARAAIRLTSIYLQDVGIDTETGKVDIDVIMTGKPKSARDRMDTILKTIADLEKQLGLVEESVLYQALSQKVDITSDDAHKLINQLVKDGLLYFPKPGYIKRMSSG
jgi:replicative DNA helicase Mcm